jgi:ubiquinone biosynthesis protein UbiJ
MTLRDLANESIERSINALIALDPDTMNELAQLHGNLVRLEFDGLPIALNVGVGEDGRLQVIGDLESEPDATIAGSPLDLLRARDSEKGVDELFAGRVRLDGDNALAQRFSRAIGGLDIDWEEQMARLIGDIPAHELGRAASAVREQGRRLQSRGSETLSDYLTEESRLLPHRFEVEAFLADIDTLRDDVERLEARIAVLEKKGGGDA